MKYTNESTYNIGDKEICFKYVKRPSLSQKMQIIEEITSGVINSEIGYEPILFNYFVAVSLADNLTNIKLPSSFQKSEEFIDKTKLYTILTTNIEAEDIIKAAKDKIEFVKHKIANNSKVDDLLDAIIAAINKFSDVDIKDVMDKFQSVSELLKQPESKIVSGILQYEETKKQKESE